MSRTQKRWSLMAVVIVVLAAGGYGAIRLMDSPDAELAENATFAVKRGPLTISVSSSGTIKALDQEIIKSEVEGRTTILSIVPEGTLVKEGDLLVELDASTLEDERVSQEISVQSAETAALVARENLAVGKNQAEADVEKAELTLEFAKQDLQKYVEGEYQNELTDAESQIAVKKEAEQQAKDKYDWSKRLYEEKYISETELNADMLAWRRAELEVKLAENKLDLLQEYTYKRQLAQLDSDVSQAEMALERTVRKVQADVAQLEAEQISSEARLARQKEQLDKIKRNIAKATIKAPASGMVVYATSARGGWRGNEEPLQEGQEVHEREELIYLPTSDKVKAEVKVHEPNLRKVSVGLPAVVTVDAIQGRTFTGTVQRIAVLPDAQMVWLNPDLKVYTTDIHIQGDTGGLRTGMSCRAEMIVDEYRDVLYVPVQSVVRIGEQPTVYVLKDGKIEKRAIKIGMDNNRMVHILEGLEEGELVLQSPPLAPGEARDLSQRRRGEGDAESDSGQAAPMGAQEGTPGASDEQGPPQGGDMQPGGNRDSFGPGAGQGSPQGGERPQGTRQPGNQSRGGRTGDSTAPAPRPQGESSRGGADAQ